MCPKLYTMFKMPPYKSLIYSRDNMNDIFLSPFMYIPKDVPMEKGGGRGRNGCCKKNLIKSQLPSGYLY